MTDGYSRVARSVRGEWTENSHFGVAAVATPEGDLVARVGSAQKRLFLRSAAKPIQLLPLVMAGGVEKLELTGREVALMCSSHGGTEDHVSVARNLIERTGLAESDLGCGVHTPLDKEAASELRRRGEQPGVLHNNCSANHLGQLLTSRLLGWPTATYLEPDHPLQQRVRELLALFAGIAESEVQSAVDGCGLPTHRLRAHNAAWLYARLADPEGGGLPADVAAATRIVVDAMSAHPDMISGPGRFTTELIRATGGRIVGKEGAEGFYGIAVLGPAALGFALKIADGTEGCRDAVVLELLRQAGCLSKAEFEQLDDFSGRVRKNHAGEVIGETVTDFELVEAESANMERAAHSPQPEPEQASGAGG